jgi:hypothetical protein
MPRMRRTASSEGPARVLLASSWSLGHSAKKLLTQWSSYKPLRHLHDCSDCFRLERLPGGPCTHWKAPPLHGARQPRPLAKRGAYCVPRQELSPRPGRAPAAIHSHIFGHGPGGNLKP